MEIGERNCIFCNLTTIIACVVPVRRCVARILSAKTSAFPSVWLTPRHSSVVYRYLHVQVENKTIR